MPFRAELDHALQCWSVGQFELEVPRRGVGGREHPQELRVLGHRQQLTALVEHRVAPVAVHTARPDLGLVDEVEPQGLHGGDRDLADGGGHAPSIAHRRLLSVPVDILGARDTQQFCDEGSGGSHGGLDVRLVGHRGVAPEAKGIIDRWNR
jgi:hypothetical protein